MTTAAVGAGEHMAHVGGERDQQTPPVVQAIPAECQK